LWEYFCTVVLLSKKGSFSSSASSWVGLGLFLDKEPTSIFDLLLMVPFDSTLTQFSISKRTYIYYFIFDQIIEFESGDVSLIKWSFFGTENKNKNKNKSCLHREQASITNSQYLFSDSTSKLNLTRCMQIFN
jgi:hypothetical protein